MSIREINATLEIESLLKHIRIWKNFSYSVFNSGDFYFI